MEKQIILVEQLVSVILRLKEENLVLQLVAHIQVTEVLVALAEVLRHIKVIQIIIMVLLAAVRVAQLIHLELLP